MMHIKMDATMSDRVPSNISHQHYVISRYAVIDGISSAWSIVTCLHIQWPNFCSGMYIEYRVLNTIAFVYLWYMWVELNSSVNGFNSIHFCCTQASLGCYVWRKPTMVETKYATCEAQMCVPQN